MTDTLIAEPSNPTMARDERSEAPVLPIWEEIAARMRSLPDDSLAALPVDGAEEHDHYLYGTPKRSES